MAKKSARELLREKVAAHAAEKKALKFGRLREVALKESKKAGEAISELAHSMRVVAESFSHLAANLDLTPPPSAASPAAKAAESKPEAKEDVMRRFHDIGDAPFARQPRNHPALRYNLAHAAALPSSRRPPCGSQLSGTVTGKSINTCASPLPCGS